MSFMKASQMENPSLHRVVIDLLSDAEEDVGIVKARSKQKREPALDIDGFDFEAPRDIRSAFPWEEEPNNRVQNHDALLLRSPILDAEDELLQQQQQFMDEGDWPQVLRYAHNLVPKFENESEFRLHNNDNNNNNNNNNSKYNNYPSGTSSILDHNQEVPSTEPNNSPLAEMRIKDRCIGGVLEVFPDICSDHVSSVYDGYKGKKTVQNIVEVILESIEKGESYPKAQDKVNQLKRKREIEDDGEAEIRKYTSENRPQGSLDYLTITRAILSGEFGQTPMHFIDSVLSASKYHLYPAYRTLEEAERKWGPEAPPYQKLKQSRKLNRFYQSEAAEAALHSAATTPDLMQTLLELKAARAARKRAEDKEAAERKHAQDEKENEEHARLHGTMEDCGCCYGEYPLNRMVHCNSETDIHWFCKACAKMNAETQVGQSKHELVCMSTDGCEAGFSNDQRNQFMNEKLTVAIDRIEAETVLRLAGIENLESCPFCPFAAEYPPIEENKLFQCQNEDCQKISCRLCKKESHIPKTCEEYAKECGLSVRRQIEEAMTGAMIRLCNKCNMPFIKDEGCNKMTCKCGNVQCYICSKSCGYNHFNDVARGGQPGNCPLFDDVDKRHHEEVNKAEKEILAKVRAEHPEYTEEDLAIKVSDKVKSDEERRKNRHARPQLPHDAMNAMYAGPRVARFGGPLLAGLVPEHMVGGRNPNGPIDMAAEAFRRAHVPAGGHYEHPGANIQREQNDLQRAAGINAIMGMDIGLGAPVRRQAPPRNLQVQPGDRGLARNANGNDFLRPGGPNAEDRAQAVRAAELKRLELERLEARNARRREAELRMANEMVENFMVDVDLFGIGDRARPAAGDRREDDGFPFLGVEEVARRAPNPASHVPRRTPWRPRFNPNP